MACTELHKSYQSCDSINQSNYRPVSSLLRQFSPQPKSSFTPLSQSRASSGASSTSGPPSTFTPPPLPPSRALPPIPAHRNQSTASPPVPAHAFGKPFSYGTATSCSLANLHQMRKPSVPQSAADHLLPCAESIPEPASGDSAAQIRRSFANERSHSMLDPPGFHSQRQRILKQQSTVSSSSDSYHLGVGSLKSTQPLTNKTSTETFTAKYITEQSSQDDDEKSDSSELSGIKKNKFKKIKFEYRF